LLAVPAAATLLAPPWPESYDPNVTIVPLARYLDALRLAAAAILLGGGALAPSALRAQAPPAVTDTVPAERAISPRGAFLRSMIVPGWGQAYVGAPGRGAVYFALETGSLWMLHRSRHQLRDARERQRWLRETGQLQPNQADPLVESREDQLEDWVTLSVFFLFFAGADAFVAAYLADFDEHVGVRPMPGGGVQLELRVPTGRGR
jgi:hypothetical protein